MWCGYNLAEVADALGSSQDECHNERGRDRADHGGVASGGRK